MYEPEFDIHFTDRQTAKKFAKKHGGRIRNNSNRLNGSLQVRQKQQHYAVRIKPRSFSDKIEIVAEARECGSVPDPWDK